MDVVEEVPVEAVIDLRHRVLRAGRPRSTASFSGDELPGTRHWRVARDGRTIAVVSVMKAPFPDGAGPGHQLRGMAVDPDLQGQGIGGVLVRGVQDAHASLWCNARIRAVPFYQRHGWQILGEAFDIDPIGLHHRMVWVDGDAAR